MGKTLSFFSVQTSSSDPSPYFLYSSARIKKAIFFFLLLWSCLAVMAVLKYNNLHSTYFDLGLFLQNLSQIASGEWSRVFLSHIQPLIAFWSVVYIFPSEEIIAFLVLVMQAGFLALPFIGIYLYFGVIPSLAFFLFFPLWYNSLSDFHIDHLAVPILFAIFFFERLEKNKLVLLFGFLLPLVKEVFALQTVFLGLYLILKKTHLREGLILIFYGVIFFFIAHEYIQGYFSAPLSFEIGGTNMISAANSPFGWLGSNIKEVIIFLITQPHIVIFEILTNKDKVLYMLYLFGALGFIPLLSPKTLVVAAPILAIALLSNLPNHHSYVHHYTAGLIAPMVVAFSEGLPRAKKLFEKLNFRQELFYPIIILGLFISHCLLSPSPIGRKFFLEKSWNYHYSIYLPSNRDAMIKEALLKTIPKDPKLIISIQNSLVFNSILQRKIIFPFPDGVKEKAIGVHTSDLSWDGFLRYVVQGTLDVKPLKEYLADYIVLDLKRPWFITDRSCHWLRGRCLNDLAFETEFLGLVESSHKYFKTVFESDGFMILKRRE